MIMCIIIISLSYKINVDVFNQSWSSTDNSNSEEGTTVSNVYTVQYVIRIPSIENKYISQLFQLLKCISLFIMLIMLHSIIPLYVPQRQKKYVETPRLPNIKSMLSKIRVQCDFRGWLSGSNTANFQEPHHLLCCWFEN